jgi:hypothetical protein
LPIVVGNTPSRFKEARRNWPTDSRQPVFARKVPLRIGSDKGSVKQHQPPPSLPLVPFSFLTSVFLDPEGGQVRLHKPNRRQTPTVEEQSKEKNWRRKKQEEPEREEARFLPGSKRPAHLAGSPGNAL